MNRFRPATPLEEMQRSWNPKPTHSDIVYHSMFEQNYVKYVKPFENFDGDDHIAKEMSKKKLEERKRNLESSSAKK